MKLRNLVSILLITVVVVIFIGCNNKSEKTNNPVSSSQNTVSQGEFEIDKIKAFILKTDSLFDDISSGIDISSQKVIGSIDGIDTLECSGQYDTFDKVKRLVGDYCTDEIIENELFRRGLANIYGRIGVIAASGENSYSIWEDSDIKLIVNESHKKIVEMEAENDNEETAKIEYTLEKQLDGEWKITKEKGYYDNSRKIEKRVYIQDSVNFKSSSKLDKHSPEYVIDGQNDTAWVEGNAGNGEGEWIYAEYQNEIEVSGIEIINGYAKNEKTYLANNRVKKVKIEFSNNESIEQELNDKILGFQKVDFNKIIRTKYIKITILEVYKGNEFKDTCISEIRFFNSKKIGDGKQ